MNIFGSIFGTDDNQDNENKTNVQETDKGTLQLRKEELDINKNKVQTGEVILSKEVVEEQQSVNVPVTHEEVVIERRTLNNQPTDSQISSNADSSDNETIRIPVTEEKIQVGKHTVVTEEISAHKLNVEETQKVDETLRREEARVDKNGDPIITNDNASSNDNISSDSFQ
jgi:uncharacterized protein (TIGR02271 family)